MGEPIQVKGFDEFERDLEQAAAALGAAHEFIPRFVGEKMEQALLLLQGQAAIYPPERPGQQYRRTYTLGRRWTTASRYISSGQGGWMVGSVGNNTWYGPLVQDEEQQGELFRGRWVPIQQIARQVEPRLTQFLAQAANEAAEHLKEEVER